MLSLLLLLLRLVLLLLLLAALLLLFGLVLLLLSLLLLLLRLVLLLLLLAALLLLFGLVLLLLILLIFVLFLLCIVRSSGPEKQKQNSCADKSDPFHLCILQSFSLGAGPSGLPQGVTPLTPTNPTCFSVTSCSEWPRAISQRRAGESCY